jgi:hypothetical protein
MKLGLAQSIVQPTPEFATRSRPETHLIIEAKGTVTREAIRMAVGQLLDYSRFVDQPKLAVLLPEVPRQDLLDFVDRYAVTVIAPRSDGLFEMVRHAGKAA